MFKSIIAAAAIAMTVTTAQAAQPVPLCTLLSSMAHNIAEARDKGLSRHNAVIVVVETAADQPTIMDFAIKTVHLAYDNPKIKPTVFGMVMLNNCLKVFGGSNV